MYYFVYQVTFLESRETRTNDRSISIDVTITRGIITFFEETPFEKPESLVGHIISKIGTNLTCETRLVRLLSLWRVREKLRYSEKIKDFIIPFATKVEL